MSDPLINWLLGPDQIRAVVELWEFDETFVNPLRLPLDLVLPRGEVVELAALGEEFAHDMATGWRDVVLGLRGGRVLRRWWLDTVPREECFAFTDGGAPIRWA